MLEERPYSISELREILGTYKKQGIDRKLTRYGVQYISEGRGENRVYTIQKITDKFKVYCITKFGLAAQCNFEKIRNIFYYCLCDDNFINLPHVEQERIIDEECEEHISRGCISRWIRFLGNIEYAHLNRYECSYFVIINQNGRKTYQETTKNAYNTGWKIYWESIEQGSITAYFKMRTYLGGHPYKKYRIEINGIYKNEINTLIEIINESFLSQTSDTI